MDFVRNSFIQFENLRFDWFERANTIRTIRKIRWKLIRNSFNSIRLQLYIGWSQIFQTLDSFEIRSIRKFMIRLIQKVKNNSKNSIKINSKFVRLTPPLLQAVLSMLLLSTVWKFKDFLSSVRFYVKSILDNLEVLNLPFFATLGVLKFFFEENQIFLVITKPSLLSMYF